jgi:hypothetical protein
MLETPIIQVRRQVPSLANCNRSHWPLIHHVNLPIEGLAGNGLAHLQLPPEQLLSFSTSSDQGTLNEARAYDETAEIIQRAFIEAFPNTRLDQTGMGTQGWNRKPRVLLPDPNRLPGFHFDSNEGSLDWKRAAKLQAGKLLGSSIRCTLLAPIDLYPPTIAVPYSGAYEGLAVQGIGSVVTVMILEVTEHTPDLRYVNDGRGLFSWDFKVRRK